jgi:hypothetical protein
MHELSVVSRADRSRSNITTQKAQITEAIIREECVSTGGCKMENKLHIVKEGTAVLFATLKKNY